MKKLLLITLAILLLFVGTSAASDYHILGQSLDGKTITVIYHFPIPAAAQNSANILYRDIVKISRDLTSQLPNFETDFPTEYADMQNGAIIEERVGVRFSSTNLTPAQKRAEIEAAYAPKQTEIFDDLQTLWEWYGYNGDIN